MPWSNQSGGGGWKGGGGGPWGPRPGCPGQQPDLEEILRRSQDRIRQAMPGGGMGGPFTVLIAVVACRADRLFRLHRAGATPTSSASCSASASMCAQLPPGLNFRWPYPIEQVELPKVTRINRTEIGMRGSTDSPRRHDHRARRARGKPDADRRREHRRHRFRRVLADQRRRRTSSSTSRIRKAR